MAINLSSKAMLVSFSASQYGASVKDKKRSKELSQDNQANENRAKVTKKLVDKSEKAYTAIVNHIQQMRLYHAKMTLPWNDDGSRILPAVLFEEYSRTMRTMQETAWKLVDELIDDWPNIMEREKASYTKLGQLWSLDDYPKAYELRYKYAFNVSIYPLPDVSDFRVSLQGEEIETLKKQYEQSLEITMQKANHDMFERLFDVVSNLADNIREPDKKFKDASVNNLCKLCDILAKLNITDNADIEKLTNDIREKLCVDDIERLRKDKEYRQEVSKEADAILDAMAGYLA